MADSMSMPLAMRGSDAAAAANYIPSADKAPEPIRVKPMEAKSDTNLGKRRDENPQTLQQNIQTVNKMFENLSLNVSFELDKTVVGSIRIIMKDANNNVIREIPSRQLNAMATKAKKSDERDKEKGQLSGLFIDSKV